MYPRPYWSIFKAMIGACSDRQNVILKKYTGKKAMTTNYFGIKL